MVTASRDWIILTIIPKPTPCATDKGEGSSYYRPSSLIVSKKCHIRFGNYNAETISLKIIEDCIIFDLDIKVKQTCKVIIM